MNEKTTILIERSLRGALDAEESEQLRQRLAEDPEARHYLEQVQFQVDLLLTADRAGAARVDWERVRRGTRRGSLRRILGLAASLGLVALAAVALLDSDGWLDRGLLVFATLILTARAATSLRELRSFGRRTDWLASGGGDFVERYRIVLRREWKRWRFQPQGDCAAALMLLVFALFGNHPGLCGVLAGVFLISAITQQILLIRPLRLELREAER